MNEAAVGHVPVPGSQASLVALPLLPPLRSVLGDLLEDDPFPVKPCRHGLSYKDHISMCVPPSPLPPASYFQR